MTPSTKRARCAEDSTAAQVSRSEVQVVLCEPQLFKAAAVVCRSRTELTGLPHVTQLISEFADPICDRWSLESVVSKSAGRLDEASAVRLLDRLLEHEWSGLTPAFRMQRFLHGVNHESNENRMQVVDWWLTKYLLLNDTTFKDIMESAVFWNRISVLERLEQECVLPDSKLFTMECGHADTAYWLHERGFSLSIDVEFEIRENNLDFMRWICEHKDSLILCQLDEGLAIAAMNNSIEMAQLLTEFFPETSWCEFDDDHYGSMDLEMIKWMIEFVSKEANVDSNCEDEADSALKILINNIVNIAADNGRLGIIELLYDHRLYEPRPELIISTAGRGYMPVVQWLYDRDPSYAKNAIGHAARGGFLDIVKWLHGKVTNRTHNQLQHPWNQIQSFKFSIDKAAECGSLELVQWLHEHRPGECSKQAMDAAATQGNFDIVSFLHANRTEGCTIQALEGAIRHGNLQMVEWLYKNRIEISEPSYPHIMDSAARHGHLESVKWLHENRSDGCTINAVDSAARNGHFEVVKFLLEVRKEGYTTEAVDDAASNGHLEVLKYFVVTRHMQCNDSAIEKAAKNGHYQVLLWLHMKGYTHFTVETLSEAIESGQVEIIRFLYSHCGMCCSKHDIVSADNRQTFAMLEWIIKHDPKFTNYLLKQ